MPKAKSNNNEEEKAEPKAPSEYKYKMLRPEVNVSVLDAELADLRKLQSSSTTKDPQLHAEITNMMEAVIANSKKFNAGMMPKNPMPDVFC